MRKPFIYVWASVMGIYLTKKNLMPEFSNVGDWIYWV